MRSWKTTLSGLVCSMCALIILMSTQGITEPKWLVITAGFVLAGGLSCLGIAGKDYNVTGTNPPSKDQASK